MTNVQIDELVSELLSEGEHLYEAFDRKSQEQKREYITRHGGVNGALNAFRREYLEGNVEENGGGDLGL